MRGTAAPTRQAKRREINPAGRRTDKDVFLYYKQSDKLYCVVVRHAGAEGFLITAYPTDKVKEGDVIWTK